MTAILALYNRTGAPVDRAVIERLLAAGRYRQSDGEDARFCENVVLAHQHQWITPEETGEHQPLHDRLTGCVITSDARLDNRETLRTSLGLPSDEPISDARVILEAYLRWGVDCLPKLEGAFAFALWDARDNRLFVARDRLGERSLCYAANADHVVVASEVSTVLAHPATQVTLNETKIADFLEGVWDYGEETCYQGVFFCRPAHGILFSADGVRTWRYWDIDPERRIRYRHHEEYVEHFRALFEEAVVCRLRTTGPVGATLSGGLDSTSVAAIAGSSLVERGESLKTFSYIFDELTTCDERAYITSVVAHCAHDATYVIGDDAWTLRDLPNWLTYRDYPGQDPTLWLVVALLEKAQANGCRVLLTGLGGDEIFLGGVLWATDALRELRFPGMLPDLLRYRTEVSWRSEVFDNGLRQLLPFPVRRAFRRRRPPAVQHPGLTPEFVERVGLRERHMAHRYNGRYTAPGQWQRYRGLIDGRSVMNITRIRQLGLRYQLEVVHPFLDRRLVEFSMAVPADELALPGQSKRLLRDAMVGVLPEEVRTRTDKTTLNPLFERGLLQHERATVWTLMQKPQIVERDYIRAEWLQKELEAGPEWTDRGSWLWDCLSLEIWLQRYG